MKLNLHMLLRDAKENLNNKTWIYAVSLNLKKISIISKSTYKYNTVPIKISTGWKRGLD